MPKILVTGGAGFIGSHVADALVRRGHHVTVLDDLSGGFRDNVVAGASLVEASITDAPGVDRVFEAGGFDYVYHLAAYAAEGLSHFIKRFNYTNNVIGSVNVLNACVNTGVKGVVFSSSIAVYGDSVALPMRESATPRPQDSYGIAKLAVEQELSACREMFDLNAIVFRPHNVFGTRQNIGDRYRNVVGIFMNQILQDQPMTIFGDGRQSRAFTYIDDVAPVMAEAIDVPAAWNETFNIGADTPACLSDLAQAVAAAMGVEPRITHLPGRHEPQHAYSSHDKLRSVFGARPTVALEDGLRAMAEWVKRHGARHSAPFAHIEVTKNLPAVWRHP